MRILLALFAFILTLSFNYAQEFGFQKLFYSSEGIQLKSRELAKNEQLTINVAGIQGYEPIEGGADLAMEIRVSDPDDKQIMYSPDMFEKQRIPVENIPMLDFSFGLGDDFEEGKTYFIKVRLWDRNTNKEMTKETSIKVLPPLRNQHIEIEQEVFDVIDAKVYLNKSRYFNGNLVREGDELYFDMFFRELDIKKKTTIAYQVGIQDIENDDVIPVEQDVMVVNDPNQLTNLNYSIKMKDKQLKPGSKYRFVINFKMEDLDAYFGMGYTFEYLKEGFESNTELLSIDESQIYLNAEEQNDKLVLFPGDRLDVMFRNLNSKLTRDNMTNCIGGILAIYDAKGKEMNRSDDLFASNSHVSTEKTSEMTMNWLTTWDIEPNQKYTLKAILWDKYSRKRFEFDIPFKGGKPKSIPYGLDKNKSINFSCNKSKMQPVATYVLKNGYLFDGDELKAGDEVFLKVSGIKNKSISASNFKTVVQIKDLQGNILTENVEDASKFDEGEVFSTITVPYSPEEIGKSFVLVCKITDDGKDIIYADYTFKIIK